LPALVIAAVALSPFWAPQVARLLAWGEKYPASAQDHTVLAARLTEIEGPDPLSFDVEAIKSAESTLARRVDQFEAALSRLQERADNPCAAAGRCSIGCSRYRIRLSIFVVDARQPDKLTKRAGWPCLAAAREHGSASCVLSDEAPRLNQSHRALRGEKCANGCRFERARRRSYRHGKSRRMAKPSRRTSLKSRLTLPPDPISFYQRRLRQTKFQHKSRPHRSVASGATQMNLRTEITWWRAHIVFQRQVIVSESSA
jgi:hypothetical protein